MAANAAHYEFLRTMAQYGFKQNRDGRFKFTFHNSKRSRHTGFSFALNEHFGGEGNV